MTEKEIFPKTCANSSAKNLTKREYFAAMAMQGYISSGKLPAVSIVTVAELSVEQADSLIKALNETKPTENETSINTH